MTATYSRKRLSTKRQSGGNLGNLALSQPTIPFQTVGTTMNERGAPSIHTSLPNRALTGQSTTGSTFNTRFVLCDPKSVLKMCVNAKALNVEA